MLVLISYKLFYDSVQPFYRYWKSTYLFYFRDKLKKIKVWVFYLIPQKRGGGGRGWSNFLGFQYSTKQLKGVFLK